MRIVRTAFLAAGMAVLPSVAWAQTTTTTTSGQPTTTSTTTAATTTTTVTRTGDLVCSEPVNQVATCVDPQGRIVTRIDEPRQVTTTVPEQQPLQVQPHGDVVVREAGPGQPTASRQLALTG